MDLHYLRISMTAKSKEKILIVRFSSIGDIVLTSPVVRSLRACKPNAELHFITKSAFVPLLIHNPFLDKVIGFEGDMDSTLKELRTEGYTQVLDLHDSLRSKVLRIRLGVKAEIYPKDRWPVLLYTRFRIGHLPSRHTVDRYGAALAGIGCKLDNGGIDFFLPPEAVTLALEILKRSFAARPVAIALGGLTATKRWPREHFAALIDRMGRPVVLLGGKAEVDDARWIESQVCVPVLVAAGEYDLLLSAALMRECAFSITHDSGFMHLASAFTRPLFSIWGSTVPELGFGPYKAVHSTILQLDGLACRPCSKLGSDKCPKAHFKCMRDLSPDQVSAAIELHTNKQIELFNW